MNAFYRPASVAQPRASRRRAASRRTAVILLVVVAAAAAGVTFGLERMRERFRVTRVVLKGVPDSRRNETEELTDRWIGQPLLFTDVDGPVAALSRRAWVARVSARRIVPDTISVQVTARPPIALARRGEDLWTVDRSGTWLGPYSGRSLSAEDDFIVIDVGTHASPVSDSSPAIDPRVAAGAALVERLREEDPALLARASEIAVLGDEGFAVIDKVARVKLLFGRDAAAPNQASLSWRAFLAVQRELERHAMAGREVDLRFANRIVLRPPTADLLAGNT